MIFSWVQFILFWINRVLGGILIFFVRIYQKTISPDHGIFKNNQVFGVCKYQPTCSEYTIEAIQKRGVIKGLILASYRLLRCNPFSKGGFDSVK